MSTPFDPRRRAEAFDDLVEGRSGALLGTGARDAELLRVVGRLRAAEQPTPRPEFVADLRERLMAEADDVLVPAPRREVPVRPDRQRRLRHDRRVAVVLGAAALVGTTGSVAVAAQSSLPGEMLYPVKQVLEAAQTGVATSDADEGRMLLDRATLRLDEAEDLAARDDEESRRAAEPTLVSFSEQAREAADLLLADYADHGSRGSVSALRDFTAASMPRLEALAAGLPAEADDELVAAARSLLEIDDLTRAACPDCGGNGVGEVPYFVSASPPYEGLLVPGTAPGDEQTSGPTPGATPGPGAESGRPGDQPGLTVTGQPPAGTPATPGTPGPSGSPTPVVPGGPLTPAPPSTTPQTPSPRELVPGLPLPKVPGTQGATPTPEADPGATPTEKSLVEEITETLVGSVGPSPSSVPTGGLVGELGRVLDQVTGSLLPTVPADQASENAEAIRRLLQGQLPGQRRGSPHTP